MIKTYRSKEKYQAVQWDGNNLEAVRNLLGNMYSLVPPTVNGVNSNYYIKAILHFEDDQVVRLGDFIVKHKFGLGYTITVYPIRDFNSRYEEDIQES